ncbi:MAG: DUF456 domain-containing protein [Armatimonadetes bacterium]|nr:DUF456 domain-containing protein [Armatimonadota bacterium]
MIVILRILAELVFACVTLLGMLISIVGLPGSILILVASVLHSAATHWHRPSPAALIVLLLIAIAAETSDNILAAMGARRHGASMRGSLAAVAGALVGAVVVGVVAQLVGVPALVGGPLVWLIVNTVAVLLGASAGAFAATYAWELRRGRPPEEARKAAVGGLIGRMLAIVARATLTTAMGVVAMVAAFAPRG